LSPHLPRRSKCGVIPESAVEKFAPVKLGGGDRLRARLGLGAGVDRDLHIVSDDRCRG
jgi:hypothetical protein